LRTAALALALLHGAPAQAACLLPHQRPMVEVELFFGREIEGRAPVTEAEWSGFASTMLGKEFPDGFTVVDAEGDWRDPGSGAVVHEGTKLVIALAKPASDLKERVGRVVGAYRAKFRQQSVGIVTRDVCAAF
jgi:Protein of unknown function (DUF3574)